MYIYINTYIKVVCIFKSFLQKINLFGTQNLMLTRQQSSVKRLAEDCSSASMKIFEFRISLFFG